MVNAVTKKEQTLVVNMALRTLLLITLFISTLVNAREDKPPQVLKLAMAEWCPYACENSKLGQGIIYDYLTMILKPKGIALDVTFLPWADAIESVKQGKHQGLLAAIRSEAPDLSFTKVPSMHYKMCLFNATQDEWQYTGQSSLQKRHIGVIEGYGYGEPIDSYLQDPNNAKKVTVYPGDNSLERLVELLKAKQIQVFIEDGYVVKWQNRETESQDYKQVGCLRPVPFYMAFNNEFAKRTKITDIIDSALANPKYKNYLNQYMLPYYFSSNSSNWDK